MGASICGVVSRELSCMVTSFLTRSFVFLLLLWSKRDATLLCMYPPSELPRPAACCHSLMSNFRKAWVTKTQSRTSLRSRSTGPGNYCRLFPALHRKAQMTFCGCLPKWLCAMGSDGSWAVNISGVDFNFLKIVTNTVVLHFLCGEKQNLDMCCLIFIIAGVLVCCCFCCCFVYLFLCVYTQSLCHLSPSCGSRLSQEKHKSEKLTPPSQ